MYLTLTLISGSVAAHGECALFCCDLSGRLGCGTLYRVEVSFLDTVNVVTASPVLDLMVIVWLPTERDSR